MYDRNSKFRSKLAPDELGSGCRRRSTRVRDASVHHRQNLYAADHDKRRTNETRPRSRLEDFVVDAVVGTGGSATVVRAHRVKSTSRRSCSSPLHTSSADTQTHEEQSDRPGVPLALKAVAKHGLARKAQRFLAREIAVHRAVGNHDHVVRLYDVFDNKAGIYLVLELLEGGDLYSTLKKSRKALSEYVALVIMEQVFDALQHIHSCGVSHRDIKLENIMFVREPVLRTSGLDVYVKLVDFGLACARNPTASGKDRLSHESCGTKNYCAPEVIRACPQRGYVPELADIWSAGVVLYTMLTRKLPFQALHQHLMSRNVGGAQHQHHQLFGSDSGYEHVCNAHAAQLKFDSPRFARVSDRTVALLRSLLSTDPSLRPTASVALEQVRRILSDMTRGTARWQKYSSVSSCATSSSVSSSSSSSVGCAQAAVESSRKSSSPETLQTVQGAKHRRHCQRTCESKPEPNMSAASRRTSLRVTGTGCTDDRKRARKTENWNHEGRFRKPRSGLTRSPQLSFDEISQTLGVSQNRQSEEQGDIPRNCYDCGAASISCEGDAIDVDGNKMLAGDALAMNDETKNTVCSEQECAGSNKEKPADAGGNTGGLPAFNLGNVFRGIFDVFTNRVSGDGRDREEGKAASSDNASRSQASKSRRLESNASMDIGARRSHQPDSSNQRRAISLEDRLEGCESSDVETIVSSVSLSDDDRRESSFL